MSPTSKRAVENSAACWIRALHHILSRDSLWNYCAECYAFDRKRSTNTSVRGTATVLKWGIKGKHSAAVRSGQRTGRNSGDFTWSKRSASFIVRTTCKSGRVFSLSI